MRVSLAASHAAIALQVRGSLLGEVQRAISRSSTVQGAILATFGTTAFEVRTPKPS